MENKVEKGYYSTGELNFEIPYFGEGIGKGYYISGNLIYKAHYIGGELHGICTYYCENKDIRKLEHYLYGKLVTKDEYKMHLLIEEIAGI